MSFGDTNICTIAVAPLTLCLVVAMLGWKCTLYSTAAKPGSAQPRSILQALWRRTRPGPGALLLFPPQGQALRSLPTLLWAKPDQEECVSLQVSGDWMGREGTCSALEET